MSTTTRNRISYDDDLAAWAAEQAALLRSGVTQGIDIENIAEEIADLSARQRDALQSRLEVLLMHLLKWSCQPERRSGSWRSTLLTQRDKLEDLLANSPSLRRLIPDMLPKAFSRARRKAMAETTLDRMVVACPWSIEQILAQDFYPD